MDKKAVDKVYISVEKALESANNAMYRFSKAMDSSNQLTAHLNEVEIKEISAPTEKELMDKASYWFKEGWVMIGIARRGSLYSTVIERPKK